MRPKPFTWYYPDQILLSPTEVECAATDQLHQYGYKGEGDRCRGNPKQASHCHAV